jgi:hypothetical protein
MIVAISQTLYLLSKVSECSSILPFNFSSSSQETGTGIFHAHKNHVTFGVFLTTYQLSFVTFICTKIYHGSIFFFFVTLFHHALIDTTS